MYLTVQVLQKHQIVLKISVIDYKKMQIKFYENRKNFPSTLMG